MTRRKILSIDELKELSKDKPIDCFISLMGGMCRSSKSVQYDLRQNVFSVFNDIVGSEDILTVEELYTDSNIGEAIDKGAFFCFN